MQLLSLLTYALHVASVLGGVAKRQDGQNSFDQGQPQNSNGSRGSIISGGTNHQLDLQNPSGLGQQSTDAGTVPNLKWSFSLSKTRIFPGGWTRTQVIQDLPQSHDIAAAQQHLKKGAIRELHWHKVAEWGFVYQGRVLISAVDENGKYQVEELGEGDIWYFPKAQAHAVQGLDDENEYLLTFDDGNYDTVGMTFNLGDWLLRTPRSILAKNFNVSESVFATIPPTDPYISQANVSTGSITSGAGPLTGNASYVYRTFQHPPEPVPGNGGTFYKIDSTNFPVAKTIAATYVTLKPGGLRELHWHPTAEEWLYFHRGEGRATVFIGNGAARTFDFEAGDTAVFPDNSGKEGDELDGKADVKGHYIENTSETEDLVWIEIYKSDRVADISLAQWLALTPHDVVASVLRIPIEVVDQIKM